MWTPALETGDVKQMRKNEVATADLASEVLAAMCPPQRAATSFGHYEFGSVHVEIWRFGKLEGREG